MLIIQPSDREYLTEIRALTLDIKNQEVFIGLSMDESIRYYYLSKLSLSEDNETEDEYKEYLALSDKHERGRLALINAEAEARNLKGDLH